MTALHDSDSGLHDSDSGLHDSDSGLHDSALQVLVLEADEGGVIDDVKWAIIAAVQRHWGAALDTCDGSDRRRMGVAPPHNISARSEYTRLTPDIRHQTSDIMGDRLRQGRQPATAAVDASGGWPPALVALPMAIDYTIVLIVYVVTAFWLGVLIDGHLVKQFDPVDAERRSTLALFAEVALQLVLQGLLGLAIVSLMRRVPSPVEGVLGYSALGPAAAGVRAPAAALFAVVLFFTSYSLGAKLRFLVNRFNPHACTTTGCPTPPARRES
jgi:hypothetical protein